MVREQEEMRMRSSGVRDCVLFRFPSSAPKTLSASWTDAEGQGDMRDKLLQRNLCCPLYWLWPPCIKMSHEETKLPPPHPSPATATCHSLHRRASLRTSPHGGTPTRPQLPVSLQTPLLSCNWSCRGHLNWPSKHETP